MDAAYVKLKADSLKVHTILPRSTLILNLISTSIELLSQNDFSLFDNATIKPVLSRTRTSLRLQ